MPFMARRTTPLPRRQAGRFSRPRGTASTERPLDRRALRREQARAVDADMHVVFQPHAELARDVDAGFVAEGHAGFDAARVALHEVIPLMHVHADAVTEAVREIRVAGTV